MEYHSNGLRGGSGADPLPSICQSQHCPRPREMLLLLGGSYSSSWEVVIKQENLVLRIWVLRVRVVMQAKTIILS